MTEWLSNWWGCMGINGHVFVFVVAVLYCIAAWFRFLGLFFDGDWSKGSVWCLPGGVFVGCTLAVILYKAIIFLSIGLWEAISCAF